MPAAMRHRFSEKLAGIDEFLLTKITKRIELMSTSYERGMRPIVSFSAGQLRCLCSVLKLHKKVVRAKRKTAENYSDSICPYRDFL